MLNPSGHVEDSGLHSQLENFSCLHKVKIYRPKHEHYGGRKRLGEKIEREGRGGKRR